VSERNEKATRILIDEARYTEREREREREREMRGTLSVLLSACSPLLEGVERPDGGREGKGGRRRER